MAAGKIAHSAQHLAEAMVGAGGFPAAGTAGDGTTTAIRIAQASVTIPTAGANVTTVVNATVNGAQMGDIVLISGPTVALTHQTAPRAQVIAADTIEISASGDGTGFTGAAKTYNLLILKQN